MNWIRKFCIGSLLFFCCQQAAAQDTLPNFSLRNVGQNRIVIGWVNNYQQVKQISIQRSFDSLNFYKTVLSVADPMAVQNGYVDTKAPNDRMFYRLFIMLDGGNFLTTPAKRPLLDTANAAAVVAPGSGIQGQVNGVRKDSAKTVVPKKPEYIPSVYVYTNKDGYLFVNLPDADKQQYRIRFFENDDSFLFEMKNIKETALTLDKANFLHAGWFKFELYNDDKLVEKNRFFLANDF
ncbi:hypothetical protein [Pseudocnuella soli]|uniref:hypothetical protein n=1 Tax=Pseudocnuella soli TaxID=2502779 RepID=UPI0010456CEE|nr:hypothetical protein [Pseudocnuella soli]